MNTMIPLENVRVASPCKADWNLMEGDDRARFCQSCAKNVYNLSAMSRADAEKLITEKQGNLCVQFYQRADGTIITDNCPVGLKIVRRPFQWLAAGFAALLASGAAIASHAGSTPEAQSHPTFDVRNSAPVRFVLNRISSPPQFTQVAGGMSVVKGKPAPPVMGEIAPCPAPTPTPTPTPKPKPKE